MGNCANVLLSLHLRKKAKIKGVSVQSVAKIIVIIIILGDVCDTSRIIDIASDADVVVHEPTLENELMIQCKDHGHSTPGSY